MNKQISYHKHNDEMLSYCICLGHNITANLLSKHATTTVIISANDIASRNLKIKLNSWKIYAIVILSTKQ